MLIWSRFLLLITLRAIKIFLFFLFFNVLLLYFHVVLSYFLILLLSWFEANNISSNVHFYWLFMVGLWNMVLTGNLIILLILNKTHLKNLMSCKSWAVGLGLGCLLINLSVASCRGIGSRGSILWIKSSNCEKKYLNIMAMKGNAWNILRNEAIIAWKIIILRSVFRGCFWVLKIQTMAV